MYASKGKRGGSKPAIPAALWFGRSRCGPRSQYSPNRAPRHAGTCDFLNCVKTRSQPAANAFVACQSHIACHAAYIAWQLGRKVRFDPTKDEFIGDDEANRMRSRAIREPWHL